MGGTLRTVYITEVLTEISAISIAGPRCLLYARLRRSASPADETFKTSSIEEWFSELGICVS